MKIGFDFHGVLDLEDNKFREQARVLVCMGHEVHILTGSSYKHFLVESKDLLIKDIHYTHFFGICDYLVEMGIKNTGLFNRPIFDPEVWNSAKGEYAFYTKLDEHYDDCEIYAKSFPPSCNFILIKDGTIV